MFDDERRRKINLGGASSAQSHTLILNQAKARRLEREAQRRQEENATRIQAWWRGRLEAEAVREKMRLLFEEDMFSITGLRCLVLSGGDETVLAAWSSAANLDRIYQAARPPSLLSWVTLMRQISLRLTRSVSKSPQSSFALDHLNVLDTLLSPSSYIHAFGREAAEACGSLARYLVNNGYLALLSRAITSIPLGEHKSSKTLPLIVTLLTRPFSTIPDANPAFLAALYALISHVLTIPLLPNRIPIASLTHLASHLPLSSLRLLSEHDTSHLVEEIPVQSRTHLIANLLTFTAPRYTKLPKPALEAYTNLLASLVNTLPLNSLDARKPSSEHADESDSEQASSSHSDLEALEPRTSRRLDVLYSPPHINTLIVSVQSREPLIRILLAIALSSSSRREEVLRAVLVHTGGGLVRELYRFYVRSSALGKDSEMSTLSDPSNTFSWPPLLFLTFLYNQALTTMGDDEFFANSDATSLSASQRNPLSLDDLATLSRQLLNIAFTLYWKPPDETGDTLPLGGAGIRLGWDGVRDIITKCLLAIHARDSRKPFTPPDHWLVTSKFDVQSFIEAAVFEEREFAADTADSADSSSTPPRTSVISRSSQNLSSRQLAYLSPRLGILNNIPFAIPFEIRVSIFRTFIRNDMIARGTESRYSWTSMRAKTHVDIRRGMVAQDGFDRLAHVDLKAPIEITFIDQFGQPEAGIDGGGVFKEFFTSLCKEVFDTDRGLWLANKKNELYPNPHAYATEPHSLDWYRFIGRILGKALYQGILVDVAFAGFFLAKFLGKQSYLDDLSSLDPDLYKGLTYLKHYDGNPEDLSLNFTVAVEEFGTTKTIDLILNGSNTPVTKENRLLYIYLVSHYRLSKQIKLQSEAFFEGLSDIIDPRWLRMFNQQELQILLGGVNSPVDTDDLRANTVYGGLYDEKHPTIVAFWHVVESFDHDQRRALLRFVSSCSRPPLLGFKELVPQFSIRDAGTNQARLPTASTCVNLLKLPLYQSEATLREKLLKSINANAGFDLS